MKVYLLKKKVLFQNSTLFTVTLIQAYSSEEAAKTDMYYLRFQVKKANIDDVSYYVSEVDLSDVPVLCIR